MTQFVSALELATYLDGTTELGDLSAEWIAQADSLLIQISEDVEDATGTRIEEGSGTVLLPGTWSRDLELPPHTTSVTAVAVNDYTLSAGEWWYNGRSTLRRGGDLTDEGDGTFDTDDALSEQGAQYRDGRGWGGPTSTAAVAIGWGFSAVPPILVSLVLRVAARTFGNVSNVTQESLAIYSVTYGNSRGEGGAMDSGSHLTAGERRRLRQAFARRAGTITAQGR